MDFRDEHKNSYKTLATISKNEKVLEDFVTQFVRLNYCRLPVKSCVDSLKKYVQANPLDENDILLDDAHLWKIGLYEVLDAIYKVVVAAVI